MTNVKFCHKAGKELERITHGDQKSARAIAKFIRSINDEPWPKNIEGLANGIFRK